MFNFLRKAPKKRVFPFKVDIHSHLLPGIDDGVKSIEETASILKTFEELGYKKIITTPHVMSEYYPNSDVGILDKLNETRKLLKNYNLNITLEAAAEYYLDENLLFRLNNKEKLLSFGGNYVLFETSFLNKPAFLEEAIFHLNTQGYQPVLAHPERYDYLYGNQKLIEKLKSMNLLFQMNLLSMTGFYSPNIKKLAINMLKSKMIDFIGSDCHNELQIQEIQKKISDKHLKLLGTQNILNNSLG